MLQHVEPLVASHAATGNMQTMRDQRIFKLGHFSHERLDDLGLGLGQTVATQLKLRRLHLDQFEQALTLDKRIRCSLPVAVEARLQFAQALVEPGMGDRRREIGDQCRSRTALGNRSLGRIVGRIEIEIRQSAEKTIRPAACRQADLLAGHEFERAMRAEMQDGIGLPGFAQVAVEGREGVVRGKAALEEQPHRIALIAEGRLDRDEQLAELATKNEEATAIAQHPARRRPPLRFDIGEMPLATHVIIDRNHRMHIGLGTIKRGIAFEDRKPERLGILGHVDIVTLGFQPRHRLEQAFEN